MLEICPQVDYQLYERYSLISPDITIVGHSQEISKIQSVFFINNEGESPACADELQTGKVLRPSVENPSGGIGDKLFIDHLIVEEYIPKTVLSFSRADIGLVKYLVVKLNFLARIHFIKRSYTGSKFI